MPTVLPDASTAGMRVASEEGRSRRDEIAIAFFGSWMLFGLFLDGWAHQAEKPETFFSPWHGVLYSGFAAALVWFAIDGYRRSGTAGGTAFVPADRLTAIGLWLFVAGALGDGVWHEVSGIEVDLEALLSPTHLLLSSYFVIVDLSVGVEWAPELVSGSVLLAAASGVLLTTLARCTTDPT